MAPDVSSALSVVAARARPVSDAGQRLLSVPAGMTDLLPEGGIRRGSTLSVEGAGGGCSVLLHVAGEVTRQGGWVAAVGPCALGLVAAAEAGIDLRRLALVPRPGPRWPAVVAALLDGFDLLILRPPGRASGVDARRLVARARERAVVLALLDSPAWPEPPDLRLSVERPRWEGLGDGHGFLRSRCLEVVMRGRRVAGRERRATLWLPVPLAPPGPTGPGPLVRTAESAPARPEAALVAAV